MASLGGKYFIQDKLALSFPHHANFKALWETKWQKLCSMGVYPFMYGTLEDFQPIVDIIIQRNLKEPYDWDEYAEIFVPQAEKLAAEASAAEQAGDAEKASELYLRSSAVYRISRFPAPRSDKQRLAWSKGKMVCLKGLSLREYPVKEVTIPHLRAGPQDGRELSFYYLEPTQVTSSKRVPLVVIFTGLDGYRTELSVWMEGWRKEGCASLVIEIPGTGDSPAAPSDPKSPDRQWNTLFEWVAQQPRIDPKRIVVWGFSTGGYYAIRLAHTHPDVCTGIVAQGGGAHHMFDPQWLVASNHLEYPFDLGKTLCHKFGYGNDFERFKAEALAKFSLLNDGTLDGPRCGRLLLINGTEDSVFPIDDYYLALQHGEPKEARFIPNAPHMGEPLSFVVILKWIYKILGVESEPMEMLKTLPFKAKY